MCLCVRLGGWSCNNLGMMNIKDISTDQEEGEEAAERGRDELYGEACMRAQMKIRTCWTN